MIEVFSRNMLVRELQYKEIDENGVETPVDVSNMIFTFIVKRHTDNSKDDSRALIKKVIELGESEDTANGIFVLVLNSIDTSPILIKPGEYVCEFQLSKEDSRNHIYITLLQDIFVVKEVEIKE